MLEEIEKLCLAVRHPTASPGAKLITVDDIAKALLLVLPVVRAAERWVNCESTCSNATCEHDDMTMAVVTMRAALEGK